ncbi:MAG: CYTH domain-containing protein [Nanoarchaeota archaeon]|nr:CYTH domain-containing protein [Nanoarchaeota archaeon]
MTARFECEVRFPVEDIKAFKEKLVKLGGKVTYEYGFTDHYYRPKGKTWNPVEKNIRIREWKDGKYPTAILLCKNEVISGKDFQFKRSLYEQGKLELFRGDLALCKTLLDDMGFEPWFEVRKEKASLWDVQVKGFNIAIEHIPGLGWTCELEFSGDDPEEAKKRIENAIGILEVPADKLCYEPVSAMYAKKMGL